MPILRLSARLATVLCWCCAVLCWCTVIVCENDEPVAKYNPDAVPSSFRPSHRSESLCGLGFYHINLPAGCTTMNLSSSTVAQDLTVLLCPETPQCSSGALVFRDTSKKRPHATRIYRVRLTGPEVFLLPITYCGAGMAVAPFSVSFPARYTLEVLQLYSAFSYEEITPLLEDMLLAREDFTAVQGAAAGAGINNTCVGADCPLCSTADAPGRWLLRPDLAPGLSVTCPPSPNSPSCHRTQQVNGAPAAIEDAVLRWQPYGCSLRPPAAQPACRDRLQSVCFFGDSQLRHVFNSFISAAFNLNASWVFTDKSRLSHPSYTYFDMRWGYDFDPALAANCSTIVANFGQWPLAHTAHWVVAGRAVRRPWPASTYLWRVDNLAQHLQRLRGEGKRVVWVTTNPLPFLQWFVNMTDFRVDPYLTLFNRVAYGVMRRYGIPVVDTYTMADTLKDFSYDRAHYKGYVGHWAAAAAAHELCRDA